jgi:hypothetical protein
VQNFLGASELAPGICVMLDLSKELRELLDRTSGRLLTRTNMKFGSNKNMNLAIC